VDDNISNENAYGTVNGIPITDETLAEWEAEIEVRFPPESQPSGPE